MKTVFTTGEAAKICKVSQQTIIRCFDSAELGLAFGREHAIHGALAAGGLGQRVVKEAARLAGFREQAGGTPADEDS